MRSIQMIPFASLISVMVASLCFAGPMGFDASLSKEKRLEAGAPSADGSCYHLDRDSGLAGVEVQVHKINIFDKNGKDPRVKQSLDGDGRKYAAIGKVRNKVPVPWKKPSGEVVHTDKMVGSGFMISPCLFLTNYHVVFGDSKEPTTEFPVSFTSTSTAVGKPVAWGKFNESGKPSEDWAMVQLDSKNCIGLDTGWFIYGDYSHQDFGKKKFKSGGYPEEKRDASNPDPLYIDHDARIMSVGRDFLNGTFMNDAATTGGNSGGPLFYEDESGVPNFVGIQAGATQHASKILRNYDPKFANLAVDANFIFGSDRNMQILVADIKKYQGTKNKLAPR